MKKIDLFDTFENAEDELMEDFTDMSPEISDEKLDKLLAVSERNYEKKKEEIERTSKADNTDDENMVSGVERVKRPVWLRPAAMAASFVLIAGTVIGSIALFNRGKSNKDLFNSDDLSNTDNGALPDVYTDKDALIELCSNATKHYDKIEATYKEEIVREAYTSNYNTKIEYDTNENILMADHREVWGSDKNGYDNIYFLHFFYKDKVVTVSPDYNWFNVDTFEDKDHSRFDIVEFFDPKGAFDDNYIVDIYSPSFLNKDECSIIGKDTICGRDCVVVEQESIDSTLTAYFDAETGVELKYVFEPVGDVGITHNIRVEFEVTDIKYNDDAHVTSPLEFRQIVEEGGYRPEIWTGVDENGNKIDPAVANNLDFLGIPDKPFTTAAKTKETETTETAATEYFEDLDAENLSVDAELGALAIEMAKEGEAQLHVMEGLVEDDPSDYIEISVDPSLNICGSDPSNNYESVENKVYYTRVKDSRFSSCDELKSYLKSVYTADCARITSYNDDLIKVLNDDELKKEWDSYDFPQYIEYRGKLYVYSNAEKVMFKGVYDEEYPVIIANKTETSFTAYLPRWGSVEYYNEYGSEIERCGCEELRFIIDPEFDDWRICDGTFHDNGSYKKLYDKLNG
jgi:hypothetical protein